VFHVTHFSSNANNGANASTFYWNVNNSSSNANRNIGTRLSPQNKSLGAASSPLGETDGRNSIVAKRVLTLSESLGLGA
jgi:hypothetical protein